MKPMYPGMVNSPITELAATITDNQTSITVLNGDSLPVAPNIFVIGQGEIAETVLYTTKSGNTISGLTRGFQGTARAWPSGTKLSRNFTAYDYDSLVKNLLKHINLTDNPHDVTKSQVGLSEVDNVKQASKTEFDTFKSDTVSQLADMAHARAGMNQQALINGNFDVAQRGKSFTNPASATYTLDRWKAIASPDGGAFPTVIHSQEIHYSEDLYGSHKFYRIASDGAGGGFGVNSSSDIRQQIENGVRLLCGSGKKVTVSFWARSSIDNKRIGIGMIQNYGTGGSPTSQEFLKGEVFSLHSYFQKFTFSFITNTLIGKTFGSNNDDWLGAIIYTMWGTATAANRFVNGATSENYVNAGTIDIAKVQVCVGEVALPFQPRSYVDELAMCQRYYQQRSINNASHYDIRPSMRIAPTITGSASPYGYDAEL